jgi:hypothetical protein
MADIKYDSVVLLMCCLNFTDKKVKDRLGYFRDHHFLDRALFHMVRNGCFPKQFREDFQYFDSLYSSLHNLDTAFAMALRGCFIEYTFGAGGTGDRLLLSDSGSRPFIKKLGVQEWQVRSWANRLSSLMLKMAEEHKKRYGDGSY